MTEDNKTLPPGVFELVRDLFVGPECALPEMLRSHNVHTVVRCLPDEALPLDGFAEAESEPPAHLAQMKGSEKALVPVASPEAESTQTPGVIESDPEAQDRAAWEETKLDPHHSALVVRQIDEVRRRFPYGPNVRSMHIPLEDTMEETVLPHTTAVAEFIDEALARCRRQREALQAYEAAVAEAEEAARQRKAEEEAAAAKKREGDDQQQEQQQVSGSNDNDDDAEPSCEVCQKTGDQPPNADEEESPADETTAIYARGPAPKLDAVYIHCHAGRSRSPTIALCYLIMKRELTLEEALDFCPTTVKPNPGFILQLIQLEEFVRQEKSTFDIQRYFGQMLRDMFPMADPQRIDKVFAANDYDIVKTKAMLMRDCSSISMNRDGVMVNALVAVLERELKAHGHPGFSREHVEKVYNDNGKSRDKALFELLTQAKREHDEKRAAEKRMEVDEEKRAEEAADANDNNDE